VQEPRVKDILTRDVITIDEGQSFAKAIEKIALQRISCVVVLRHQKPVGLVTERDVVALANRQISIDHPINMTMMRPIVCISENTDILEATSIMETQNIRRLLVVDDRGNLAGIITQSNILQSLGPYYSLCFRQVASVMDRNVFSMTKESTASQAVAEMAQKELSYVVVLEGRRPIGIFTERDVVNLIKKETRWNNMLLNEVMSRPVISIPIDIILMDAIRTFQRHNIRRLLVVNKNGEFEGIITQTGIVRKLKLDYVDHLKQIISIQNIVIDESEKKYQSLVESAQIGIIIIHGGLIRFANPMFQRMVNLNQDSLINTNFLKLVHPDDQERAASFMNMVLDQGRSEMSIEFRLLEPGPEPLYLDVNLIRIQYEKEQALLATIKDITQRKKNEEEIRRLIITDELTEIYNHRHFIRELTHEVDKANRYHTSFSLLFVDIDNFKDFNDRFGHLEGDNLLKSVADLIKKVVRSPDLIFRYGGEEYTVLMPSTELNQALVVAERLCRTVAETSFCVYVQTKPIEVHKTLSIGVAEFSPGDDANLMIKKADQAMYRAKNLGKNRVEIF